MNNIIEINNLTKKYGKARGISDLNFSVKEGDMFGFIGPNGAGKSTTIRLMLGLISPSSGSISIFEKDSKENKIEILQRVGYMPSEAMFYPKMRVDEIIDFSAKLHNKNCKNQSSELCERLKVNTKKKIEELSLGNRKKISIICAMQHEPDLYIMDEPTSGLDPLMQKEFFDLLLERNKRGATVFLSSHILSEIQRYCKNAAVVREGKLITVDSVEQLAKANAKRVKIYGICEVPKLDGIKDIFQKENNVEFLYHGKIAALINELQHLSIDDMVIEEPSMEEIFMHFYEN
ncbi:ATP-binding cassette domain-containing protein [Alkalibaculum sp. M08DMB]|uniref:ATP-binding cassette domain-containing protein n=1 Tax=Alkalibaculum sporogenes TaxID=2655001 RepID=A0A6A7K7N9_9FIRM|nr:ABC transporter ATP-binding protein [Alkalibaculum sporogenes]MPW25499.1 ATP-binding cassette domain-containing protein [Alkalibaculum sporogenes]